MRRMIGFLLILAFCLSLACPVFAAVPSPGESGAVVLPDYNSGSDGGGSGKWPSFLGDNPKTGDIILFWVLVMLVSMAALGAVYVIYRRKFRG